ncbi:DUF4304 domain-containing protein [Bacillus sp. sid0103]|uniref:DUF4304 domain-containing protein n=1 Tax=Bacillus sp. sid0103 TaxID=2856337 RepID=UPI001C44B79B|nr:DUF4304 domain-containing protein [Bacillus sp. sid0103]MBV7509031.1 DUF4304 domain-containing protein [Bacillus sp. sid0103]
MDSKEFREKVTDLLVKKMGFKKKNNDYYLEKEEVIAAIQFQKSGYDNCTYYINYGFIFKEIAEKPIKVSYKHWHTNWRLNVKINGKALPSINIENCLDTNFLISFENEVKEEILPYITVEGIKRKINSNPVFKYGLYVQAQEFLEI